MRDIPHIIKYMGSKRSILNFVHDTIFEIHKPGQRLYDVFGGSAIVSGSLRNDMPVTCNDIQNYTAVIAGLYLNNYNWQDFPEDILHVILKKATKNFNQLLLQNNVGSLTYEKAFSYSDIIEIEAKEKSLMNLDFNSKNHLFLKYYSGTYWSAQQCAWIDAISAVAREPRYRKTFLYNVILCSLMFGMAYCSQSTGHYAQYRDTTISNTADLLIYRKKSMLKLFTQKFEEIKSYYNNKTNSDFSHQVETKGYLESINSSIPESIIYADPPYQFVHYSRFYHALETLARYDYPEVKHKGRYREDRHQSPFCIKTKVVSSFRELFQAVREKKSNLVLSYSDNGMITLDILLHEAKQVFGVNYTITQKELAYNHSTMGRSGDKSRKVNEVLLIIQMI